MGDIWTSFLVSSIDFLHFCCLPPLDGLWCFRHEPEGALRSPIFPEASIAKRGIPYRPYCENQRWAPDNLQPLSSTQNPFIVPSESCFWRGACLRSVMCTVYGVCVCVCPCVLIRIRSATVHGSSTCLTIGAGQWHSSRQSPLP